MNVISKIINFIFGGQTSSSNLGDSSTKLLVLVTRNKLRDELGCLKSWTGT